MLLLVYGGEVDCYRTVDGKRQYVELKTSREIDNQRQDANFKRYILFDSAKLDSFIHLPWFIYR